MSDLRILNLAKYEKPEVKESKREEWVEYGESNDYFNWLIERFENSPTNNAIINNVSRLIVGKGLYAKDANRKPNEFAQMMTLFSPECQKMLAKDYKLFGQAALQVIYSKDKKKIARVEHIPVHLLRPEKCNKDGEIEAYYYSDDWSDVRKYEPQRIKAFGVSEKPADLEILYIKDYAVGKKYFGDVDYRGALAYTILEEEISEYLINEVQNGFSGTKVVNFNNGVPSEEQQDIISRKVLNKLTGSRGQKVIVAFNNNAEAKTTVDDIPLNDAPEHYEYLSKEAEQKILIGHNVTSPMLVGVVTDNQGFSSNADEIEIASRYFYNSVVVPFQETLIDAFDRILAYNGVALDLYFKRLNLLENLEEAEQKEESDSYGFSSDLELLLNELGEEVDENWTLIDEREVDYDLETELDSQVKEWESELSQTTLSKVWKFFSGGYATPNRESDQDKEIDGFYFKVRYKYVGNESPERDFCKAMMRASKVYRKEDITRLSSQGVNRKHGHKGQPYDIFLYKGGVSCHHKWIRQTYVSTSKNASIGSAKTSQISTNKGEKFGYRVRNPKEVAMMPKDMPNNGHHPDYGK
jgi:hypothetical protein